MNMQKVIINLWLRAAALAFAAAHLFMAARCRACIRSRSFIYGCALPRLHSQPLIYLWLRAAALAFAAAHLFMAARCRACIRSRSFGSNHDGHAFFQLRTGRQSNCVLFSNSPQNLVIRSVGNAAFDVFLMNTSLIHHVYIMLIPFGPDRRESTLCI